MLGSIPLPSYVIAPVEPDDHINRKYAFKVTLKWHSIRFIKEIIMCMCSQHDVFIIYDFPKNINYNFITR